jgi:hypothetical protein
MAAQLAQMTRVHIYKEEVGPPPHKGPNPQTHVDRGPLTRRSQMLGLDRNSENTEEGNPLLKMSVN